MNIGSSKKGGPVGASAGKTPHGLDQSVQQERMKEDRSYLDKYGEVKDSINNCAIFVLIK